MESISFKVHGDPIAQPRARAVASQGHARMHDAPKKHPIHVYKAGVAQQASEAIKAPIQGPVSMKAVFVFMRPKSHFGTGKNAEKLKDSAPDLHTKKPDLDNLMKAVKDAMKGIAWRDDSQVCAYEECFKRYTTKNEQAHTYIELTEL